MISVMRNETPSVRTPKQTLDYERMLASKMIRTASIFELNIPSVAIVNLIVSLKSKPLAILAGPRQVGKDELVRIFAQFLTNSDSNIQYQFVTGHPWWAEKSNQLASFSYLHSQFNAQKLHLLFEDAAQFENKDSLYLAFLSQISPAEVGSFFEEISRQLMTGRIIHLAETTLPIPFVYPDNLLLVGTINSPRFEWYEESLLANTNIIQLNLRGRSSENQGDYQSVSSVDFDGGREFLSSQIRDEGAAHMKLQRILNDHSKALKPVLKTESVLLKYGAKFSTRQITSEAIIYLSNAWSRTDNGLFDPSNDSNLEIALDYAIVQNVLPRALRLIRDSQPLRTALLAMFDGKFPNAQSLIDCATQEWYAK